SAASADLWFGGVGAIDRLAQGIDGGLLGLEPRGGVIGIAAAGLRLCQPEKGLVGERRLLVDKRLQDLDRCIESLQLHLAEADAKLHLGQEWRVGELLLEIGEARQSLGELPALVLQDAEIERGAGDMIRWR